MFWRTSLRSVVAVAVAAFALALNGAGLLDGPCSSLEKGLGHGFKSALAGLRGSVDGIVNAGPVPCVAGPACLIVVTGDEIVGLDRDGYIASCDSACSRSDLPALTGFFPASKKVGERATSAEIVIGLEILRAFEDRPDMLKMLSEVNLGDLRNPTAILTGGVKVSLGKGDYTGKIDKLDRVLANLERLKISAKTVDMRFDRQAVVTFMEPKRKTEAKNTAEVKKNAGPKTDAGPKTKTEPKKNTERKRNAEPKHKTAKHGAKKGV